jgi:molybdopterin/thiamine biosynthesis adenylyltransferase
MQEEIEFLRQRDIFDPDDYKESDVSIVGVGSIGSFTSLVLSKMGITKFVLYDFDRIEDHNIPNQFYMLKQIGGKKNEECKKLLKSFNKNLDIITEDRVKKDTVLMTQTVISCCDNMATRRLVYELIDPRITKHLLDARMGGEVLRIYSVDTSKDMKQYEKTLYSDDKAEKETCTSKAIIYNVAGAASLISNQIKKMLKEEDYHNEIVFDFKNMMMITKKW